LRYPLPALPGACLETAFHRSGSQDTPSPYRSAHVPRRFACVGESLVAGRTNPDIPGQCPACPTETQVGTAPRTDTDKSTRGLCPVRRRPAPGPIVERRPLQQLACCTPPWPGLGVEEPSAAVPVFAARGEGLVVDTGRFGHSDPDRDAIPIRRSNRDTLCGAGRRKTTRWRTN
jgi:hypothetical protein